MERAMDKENLYLNLTNKIFDELGVFIKREEK